MIRKIKKGFTLIELVVVIAVIAILSAVSVVAYVGITNNARKSSASQKAAQIVNVIRAGALASDKGYTEQVFDSAARYTVKLDGKKLTCTYLLDSGEMTELEMVNDMLSELESSELKADYVNNEAENKTEIGVLIEGKNPAPDKDGPKAYSFASF